MIQDIIQFCIEKCCCYQIGVVNGCRYCTVYNRMSGLEQNFKDNFELVLMEYLFSKA